MLATLTSCIVCYFLAVAFWYILRFYFIKRNIPINNYYAFIAGIFSLIAINIITGLMNIRSLAGGVMSGMIVMGLFSLDKDPATAPNNRKKALLGMFIGSVCGGILSALFP